MPIHDWTRVTAGTFHDLHVAWIAELRRALNGGVLPDGYYAQAEQVVGTGVPDVLTLHDPTNRVEADSDEGSSGGLAVATAPPRAQVQDTIQEASLVAGRQRRVAVRHATDDRVVALLEVVSPGNKDRRQSVGQFVDKAVDALGAGVHVQVLDLFPPGPYDRGGMHAAVWLRLGGWYEPPPGRPLTLASYAAAGPVRCYVDPAAAGLAMADLALFLTPERYVNVPLEKTYMAAYEGVPRRWKRVIEAGSA